MRLNIWTVAAALAAAVAASACGDDTATTGSSGASGSSTANGSTATTANTSTTNGSSGLATMGGSSATMGATDSGPGTTAGADSSGTAAVDSSSGGGSSSSGSSGEGDSSSSSSTSEGEVDSGPMCSAEGMSCAGGETCCAGLNCCGGVPVPPGAEFCGAVCPVSDYRRKREFAAIDPNEVLDKVAALPITTWSYRHEDAAIRHIGPMAQDFMASFEVGASDESIFVIDADGVSLAAIQALYGRVRTAEQENKTLRRTVDALEQRLAALEAR